MGKKSKSTVERKLYYYDIVPLVYNAVKNSIKPASNNCLILTEAFKHILTLNQKLNKTTDPQEIKEISDQFKYVTENGDIIYIIVDDIDIEQKIIKYRIVMSRTDAFPYIEKNGKLTAIASEIEGEFNIAEITHCCIFLDTMIMGAEFNFNGARPSTIIHYLPKVFPSITQMYCIGKIKDNAFDLLFEEKTLSLFRLAVRNTPSMKTKLMDSFRMFGAFFDDIGDIDTYEISIQRRKTKKKRGFTIPLSFEELKNFAIENREDIAEFKIGQGAYKDAIDLLNNKLVCTKEFIYTENKTIDSTEMYSAINNFYASNLLNQGE